MEKTATREVLEAAPAGAELLTMQQASKLLKVHPNTLRNWERAGVIPVVRVGPRRDRRFPKHGLHKFLPKEYAALAAREGTATAQAVATAAEGQPPRVVDTAEASHVIVNVWPKLLTPRNAVFLIVVVVVGLVLSWQLRSQEPSVAIRRNPPTTIFSDDFEVYEIGAIPRPIWNTIGVWNVHKIEGQRVLRGEEGVDNPLGILSHTYTGSSVWQNYRLKFDARVVSGHAEIIALVNYLDENNYYAVKFGKSEVKVTLVRAGQEKVLGTAPVAEGNLGEWETYAIDLYGDSIDVQVLGERVLGINDAGLTSGKVGFAVSDQVVEIDHVQVLESDGEDRPNSL